MSLFQLLPQTPLGHFATQVQYPDTLHLYHTSHHTPTFTPRIFENHSVVPIQGLVRPIPPLYLSTYVHSMVSMLGAMIRSKLVLRESVKIKLGMGIQSGEVAAAFVLVLRPCIIRSRHRVAAEAETLETVSYHRDNDSGPSRSSPSSRHAVMPTVICTH